MSEFMPQNQVLAKSFQQLSAYDKLAQPDLIPGQQAIEGLALAPEVVDRASQIAQNTSPEGILKAIIDLHTELAPEVPHEPSSEARSIVNPTTGEVSSILAKPEERMKLFDRAAETIKALGESLQPGQEQAFLNRSANVLALTVVLAHTFEDGNGRTARTLAHAVRYGSEINDENKDDYEVIGRNRTTEGFRITSYVPTKDGSTKSASELIEAAASLDIPLSDTAEYQQRAHENFTFPYSEA